MIRDTGSFPSRWLFVFAGLTLMGFSLVFAQGSAGEQALRHLQQNRRDLGLTGSDVGDVVISSTVVSTAHRCHPRLPAAALSRHRRVGRHPERGTSAATARRCSPAIASSPTSPRPPADSSRRRAAEAAASDASGHLKLRPTQPFQVLERKGGPNEAVTLSDGGIAARPIEGKLVWVPTRRLRASGVGSPHRSARRRALVARTR